MNNSKLTAKIQKLRFWQNSVRFKDCRKPMYKSYFDVATNSSVNGIYQITQKTPFYNLDDLSDKD